MGQIDQLMRRENLLYWLLARQDRGFHGRMNKPDDTCYTYWIGGTLKILDSTHLLNRPTLEEFLNTTISKYGGYGKHPDSYPDVMHSYMGLAGLSFVELNDLEPVFAPLGISMRCLKSII